MRLIDADAYERRCGMNIYESTNAARALLYWAKQENVGEVRYLEDRMYAVADNGMVILLTADSYDEAIRKAKARHTQERPKGEWDYEQVAFYGVCSNCGVAVTSNLADIFLYEEIGKCPYNTNFCPNCGADMKKGGAE